MIEQKEKKAHWPDPTASDLETPEFNAVWETIKSWDIATGLDKDGEGNDLYSGATGNHVVAILNSLRKIGLLEG